MISRIASVARAAAPECSASPRARVRRRRSGGGDGARACPVVARLRGSAGRVTAIATGFPGPVPLARGSVAGTRAVGRGSPCSPSRCAKWASARAAGDVAIHLARQGSSDPRWSNDGCEESGTAGLRLYLSPDAPPPLPLAVAPPLLRPSHGKRYLRRAADVSAAAVPVRRRPMAPPTVCSRRNPRASILGSRPQSHAAHPHRVRRAAERGRLACDGIVEAPKAESSPSTGIDAGVPASRDARGPADERRRRAPPPPERRRRGLGPEGDARGCLERRRAAVRGGRRRGKHAGLLQDGR